MKRLFWIACLLISGSLFAQEDVLDFEENAYNFGVVNEKGGPVKHVFKFVNSGDKSVKIANARASCGCTSPSWTREVIEPGDTGFVAAQYNPNGRPGNFNKYVMIYLDNNKHTEKIYIQGFVQSPMPDPSKVYRDVIGSLRFKSVNFNMGNVEDDKKHLKIFQVFNGSQEPMTMEAGDLPEHVSVTFEPEEIKPRQVGNIRLTYDAAKADYYGMKTDEISFKTNDSREPVKTVKLNAEIVQVFSDSAKNDPNRPVLSVDDDNKYLGTVEEGKTVKTKFELTNTGKTPLEIKNVYATCACLATTSRNKTLKPGKTTKIKVKFDSSGKSSHVTNKITVISSDPNNPRRELKVRAKVTPKEQ